MRKRTILLFVLLLLSFYSIPNLLFSQNVSIELKKGEEMSFFSEILNEQRQILVSKPEYGMNIGKRIPVIYVLDGSAHFDYLTGLISYLHSINAIPPVMVVAIMNVDRNRDFTSVADKKIPESGGAEKFISFIQDELKPLIREKYFCSDYDILMGHSLGGLFTNWSLLYHPDYFDAYLSISPYLQYGGGHIIAEVAKNIGGWKDGEKELYMTLGDEKAYTEWHDAFLEEIDKKSPDGLHIHYEYMPEENHTTIPVPSAHKGLMHLFRDWAYPRDRYIEGLESLNKHYSFLHKKYGVTLIAQENTINLIGYTLLQTGETEEAIKTFKENVKRFPGSANVYDSLGDAYKISGDKKNAFKNYSKAVKLGEEQKSPFLSTFITNMESVKLVKH